MLNKLFAILKATALTDINIFSFSDEKKKISVAKKIIFGILSVWIILMLIFTMVFYVYLLAEPLSKVGLTYVALALYYIITVIFMFIGGVNKSQGVLFTSKDNNMLLAMPIKRSTIFLARFIKLLLFEYIWTLFIMLPTIGVYVYFEHPSASFYILSLVMLIMLPIIPMILSSIVGYIIQLLSSKVKRKNTARIIYNVIFTFGLMYIVYGMESYIPKIIANATSIANMLSKIYYPVGLYISNIMDINVLNIVIYMAFNILLIIAFTIVFSKGYFKLLSNLIEGHTNSHYKIKDLKKGTIFAALFSKEVKRFYSSSIYVMNTMIGVVLFLIAGAFVLIKGEQGLTAIVTEMSKGETINFSGMISKAVLLIAGFCISTTAITASSISIEGKNLWFTKSLPIEPINIFKAKIFNNIVMVLPFMLVGTVLFAIGLKMELIDFAMCILLCIIFTVFEALFGLLVNLKFPKLDASNDTIIVKQSLSSMLGIFVPMALVFIPLILIKILDISNINLFVWCYLGIYAFLDIILWFVIKTYGTKRLYHIN